MNEKYRKTYDYIEKCGCLSFHLYCQQIRSDAVIRDLLKFLGTDYEKSLTSRQQKRNQSDMRARFKILMN